MATRLKGLKLERCDLVDEPANPHARVLLVKRAEDGPSWLEADKVYKVAKDKDEHGYGSYPRGEGGGGSSKPVSREHAAAARNASKVAHETARAVGGSRSPMTVSNADPYRGRKIIAGSKMNATADEHAAAAAAHEDMIRVGEYWQDPWKGLGSGMRGTIEDLRPDERAKYDAAQRAIDAHRAAADAHWTAAGGRPEKKSARLSKRITRRGSKWLVTTEDGSRTLGTHDTKADAVTQLAAVESNKRAFTGGTVSQRTKSLLKRFVAFLKEAMPPAAAPPDPMSGFIEKLGNAIKAYGDGAGLAADHPFHALKALHGDMVTHCDQMKQAAVPTEPDDDEGGDFFGDDDVAAGIAKSVDAAVTKATVDLRKSLDEANVALTVANKRAADQEAVAKAAQAASALDAQKTFLRKYKHVPVDIEKEASFFQSLADKDKAAYDGLIAKMDAAEAIAAKSGVLEAELGTSRGGGNAGTAWAEIEAEAAKLIEKDGRKISKAKAIDIVMKKRSDLVKRYYEEQAQAQS